LARIGRLSQVDIFVAPQEIVPFSLKNTPVVNDIINALQALA